MPLTRFGRGCRSCLTWNVAERAQCSNEACRQNMPAETPRRTRERTDDKRRSESPRFGRSEPPKTFTAMTWGAPSPASPQPSPRWKCCICGYSNAANRALCSSSSCTRRTEPRAGSLADVLKEAAAARKKAARMGPNDHEPDCVRDALLASLHDAEILLEQLKAMPDSPPIRALIEAKALQRERTLSAIVKTRPLNMQIHICQGITAKKKRQRQRSEGEISDLDTLLAAKRAELQELACIQAEQEERLRELLEQRQQQQSVSTPENHPPLLPAFPVLPPPAAADDDTETTPTSPAQMDE